MSSRRAALTMHAVEEGCSGSDDEVQAPTALARINPRRGSSSDHACHRGGMLRWVAGWEVGDREGKSMAEKDGIGCREVAREDEGHLLYGRWEVAGEDADRLLYGRRMIAGEYIGRREIAGEYAVQPERWRVAGWLSSDSLKTSPVAGSSQCATGWSVADWVVGDGLGGRLADWVFLFGVPPNDPRRDTPPEEFRIPDVRHTRHETRAAPI